jgi:hypothetical protein
MSPASIAARLAVLALPSTTALFKLRTHLLQSHPSFRPMVWILAAAIVLVASLLYLLLQQQAKPPKRTILVPCGKAHTPPLVVRMLRPSMELRK